MILMFIIIMFFDVIFKYRYCFVGFLYFFNYIC